MNDYDQHDLAAAFATFRSSPQGLTNAEARARTQQYGLNDVLTTQQAPPILRFLALFANPLALILLLAAVVSGFLGDLVNATIIALMVVMSAMIDFLQTTRSQNAAAKLRSQVEQTAIVLRDGVETDIPSRLLVPGDVVRLLAGHLVPGDARLIESRDLHVNQAALTGESLPVEKEAHSTELARAMVFLGTSIVSGTATALIVATGTHTQFGDIAARLATRSPETAFEQGTRKFGFFVMQTVFFLIMFVIIVSVAFRKDAFESLLFAVALAVGLTPEFLPMITTVTLATGALNMARQHVIVKNLASIQNFGSMDVLCSDKTGTLTSGEMTLDSHVDAFGSASPRVFLFGYLNSLYETGVRDPTDAALLHRANLNPLDMAILAHDHPDVHTYEKVDEIPFDFERRRISIVVGNDGRRLLITKGAPESVVPLCVSYEGADGTQVFDATTRAASETVHRTMSARGLRVLAVAYRSAPIQETYRVADETALTLAGYLAFVDPPLSDAADIVRTLREDGISIKIITGDNEAVARHVCAQVGLNADAIVLGTALDAMSDTALAQVAEQTDVFARVSPIQKNRIILALKQRSHVVGYLGDGINDAPSLHAADVGISVASAVDVAKDAADIILLERGLRVLHTGIIEGRKAFGNVMKYLLMGTSSNFGNMFSMAGAFLFLPFLPMLPAQILLNNFLYDFSQITIPTDNVDESFTHKPHKWNISFIRTFMLIIGPISSLFDFLTFFVMLNVFHASESLFHTGWFVESLATQTLVLFIIRTQGNPFRSHPSRLLAITVLAIVALGILLPFTPLAVWLGFVPLPLDYFVFLSVATVIYLLLVEAVKRYFMQRLLL